MRELPSGTVTFLFSDIEGSTMLLDELGPERYAESLAAPTVSTEIEALVDSRWAEYGLDGAAPAVDGRRRSLRQLPRR